MDRIARDRSTDLVDDRERIDMAFIQLDERQVVARDTFQHPPALERASVCGQWQTIEAGRDDAVEESPQRRRRYGGRCTAQQAIEAA